MIVITDFSHQNFISPLIDLKVGDTARYSIDEFLLAFRNIPQSVIQPLCNPRKDGSNFLVEKKFSTKKVHNEYYTTRVK